MIVFWILVAGLAGLALLFALAPLLGTSAAAEDQNEINLDEINLQLFKQKVAELDADLTTGKLDQSQYDAARQDLEREALNNIRGDQPKPAQATATAAESNAKLTARLLLVILPLLTVGLYLLLGNRDIIPMLATSAADQSLAARGHSGTAEGMPALDVLVKRLEERMQQTPNDVEGWVMLGRTYFTMRDTTKAEAALAKAHELMPTDSQVLLTYAEAIAANQDNNLQGRPSELIAQALKLNPEDVTARWLSGMSAFQRGQYNAAVVTWKNVLAELDPNSEDANQLRSSIANAEQRAGVPPEARQAAPRAAQTQNDNARNPADPRPNSQQTAELISDQPTEVATDTPTAEPNTTDQAAAGIQVTVSLSPSIADNAAPESTVFIYAKAAEGPPMPLAVQRIGVAALPATVRLDDSMAMMPTLKLSSFPQVIVGARVSSSGQALPQSGDLQGETGPIPSNSAEPVSISIDQVLP